MTQADRLDEDCAAAITAGKAHRGGDETASSANSTEAAVPWYVADLQSPPEGYVPPPPEPGGPPYESEDVYYDFTPAPAAGTEFAGGPGHPWDEMRLPESGSPCPEGMADPLAPQLIDTARHFLNFMMGSKWSPARLMRFGKIWQWQKFDLLDWLRPIELVLRRMLLIEAITLIVSQTLPVSAAARPKRAFSRPASTPPTYDPARPENWRVSFRVVPPAPRKAVRRSRRRLPPIDPDRGRCQPKTPLRFRRVLHDAAPIALRLEAAIRVVLDPMPYARRLAFRLRRRRNPNVSLLIVPRRPFLRLNPRDALLASGNRGAELHQAWWSSA